jgi:hypothetical protein
VHSRQYYGADLAFGLTLTITSHLHLLPAVSCVAEDDGRPFAWVNWAEVVRRLRGGSWDLSFAKPTRWITQPVGWWGSTGEHAGEDA